MASADFYLIAVSCAGIALAIVMIARLGFHPFIGLLSAALLIGIAAGMPPLDAVKAAEKGFGDILGGTGLVVALGLGLGAILQASGAAQALAAAALRWTGQRHAALGGLLAAMVLGLPLFFETGVVLLLPIIAAGLSADPRLAPLRLKVMLSALAGLSVLHALLPPHPGPLIAVKELGAPLGRTMLFGFLAAIPTALVAGPLLARLTVPGVRAANPDLEAHAVGRSASPVLGLIVLLFPVALIAAGALSRLRPGEQPGLLAALADPVPALLLANLLGLVLLFGRGVFDRALQDTIWTEAVRPAAGILLSIGAGGALKQVLVGAGLADVFARAAALGNVPPVLMAWAIAAAIRLATGSATVATITAAGVMAGVAARGPTDPTFLVLAIGAGSVFLSHVNDPGFWLVKGYLGTSTRDTFRTWSTLETAISLVGLAMVLLLQAVFG